MKYIDARHIPLGSQGLDLRFTVAELLEVAEGDLAQRVARRADFLVDLVAALELLLVPMAEQPVAGEVQLLRILVELVLGRRLDEGSLARQRREGRADAFSQRPQHHNGEKQACEDSDDTDHDL
jgi:hypothetical protein